MTTPTTLVSIEPSTGICRRYEGTNNTHGFLMEPEKITPEMVEGMRQFPDTLQTEAA